MEKLNIAQKLVELRGNRPQKEVAQAVGVSPMAISLYESGNRIPQDDVKKRLADYFGVTVEYLFFT